jgi:(1->4)-alpha-D-glucan 1-alpha-D-glucosylmutase
VAELNLASPEARDALHRLIEVQAFRLAHWRVAADEINYRRFFDINDLAAVRMERDEVFEATQSFALDLAAAGVVDGLRIDHPDGLYDPAGYFRKLQEGYASRAGLVLPTLDAKGRPARPLYVVAEKIAGAHEEVPERWHVHGTTGYRFANVANGVLVDTTAEANIVHAWQRFTGEMQDFASMAQAGRREVMRTALSSELNVLSTELLRIARADRSTRDYTLNALRRALAGVARACRSTGPTSSTAPRRRTSVSSTRPSMKPRGRAPMPTVRSSVSCAARCAEKPWPRPRPRWRTGAALRLALPAVQRAGGGQGRGRHGVLPLLSAQCAQRGGRRARPVRHRGRTVPCAQRRPRAALAAHHARDLDARQQALGRRAQPDRRAFRNAQRVDGALTRWHGLCRGTRKRLASGEAPSRADEYLLYQTLLGSLPLGGLDAGSAPAYADRIWQYMQKAAREAKLRTRWSHPDADYEAALESFVREILAGAGGHLPFGHPAAGRPAGLVRRMEQPDAHAAEVRLARRARSLPGQRAHRAEPGRPRQPAPGGLRAAAAAARCAAGDGRAAGLAARVRSMAEAPHDGRAKLWFIWRLLSLRREQPLLFRDGSYEPLVVEGPLARHVVAFARRHEGQMLVVVAGRLFVGLSSPQGAEDGAAAALPDAARWNSTTVRLPQGVGALALENLLTGESLPAEGDDVRLADALRLMPWAAFHARTLP